MIRIEHTAAQGTLVRGTTRGDGAAEILRKVHPHFRWNRDTDAILLLHSRHLLARTVVIEQAKTALENAGLTVEVHITDSAHRDLVEVESERANRAEARAQRHEELAEKAEQRWTGRAEQNRQVREAIPLGQPLNNAPFVRRLQKSDDIVARDIETHRYHEQQAKSARETQRHRENPLVTTRRLERLQAQLRKLERERANYSHSPDRYHSRRASLADQITYWTAQLASQESSGRWRPWKSEHFRIGDEVDCSGRLCRVLRVNPKSVAVEVWIDGRKMSWTQRVPYNKITGRHRDGEFLTTPPPDTEATRASRCDDLIDGKQMPAAQDGPDRPGSRPNPIDGP